MGIQDDADYKYIHVKVLAEALTTRYKVNINLEEIKAVRRISRSGAINIVFHDQKPGSAYFNLVQAMKTRTKIYMPTSPSLLEEIPCCMKSERLSRMALLISTMLTMMVH